MCGIVACILKDKDAAPVLLSCVKRLEYRGYDSVGIATSSQSIEIKKDEGKIDDVQKKLELADLPGKMGIAHVNNTVLAVWFEQARNPIFRMFTPDLDLSYENWKLIMVRTDFDFLCQMYFEKDVELRTYVVKIGNTSFTLRHEAWQEGKIKVKGNAVVVHYDFVNETSVPIPDSIRAQLAEHMLPETEIESINSQEMALMNNK